MSGETTTVPLRPLDALDLVIVEAMCLATLGPDQMSVSRRDGSVELTLPATAVRAVRLAATSSDPVVMEGWMELVEPWLVEDVVARTGECWLAEAELSVCLALATRADDLALLTTGGEQLSVTVATSREAGEIIAADVPSPALIHFI